MTAMTGTGNQSSSIAERDKTNQLNDQYNNNDRQ